MTFRPLVNLLEVEVALLSRVSTGNSRRRGAHSDSVKSSMAMACPILKGPVRVINQFVRVATPNNTKEAAGKRDSGSLIINDPNSGKKVIGKV